MITLTTILSESAAAQLLIANWASSEDLAQAALHQNNLRRHNFLLARASLKALLTDVTGISNWNIHPDSNGKPHAFTTKDIAYPHISISHTRGLVACAVSQDSPIGIDVEYWRTRDFRALAAYAFGMREREEVAHKGISAFYRIWTVREAIAKISGIGILAMLDGMDYASDSPASGCWTTGERQVFYSSPHTDYSLAVASPCSEDRTEVKPKFVDVTAVV